MPRTIDPLTVPYPVYQSRKTKIRESLKRVQTAEVIDAIKAAVAAGQERITPATFSFAFGRGVTAAAFRKAKADGIIVVNYISVAGTPVYKGAK